MTSFVNEPDLDKTAEIFVEKEKEVVQWDPKPRLVWISNGQKEFGLQIVRICNCVQNLDA